MFERGNGDEQAKLLKCHWVIDRRRNAKTAMKSEAAAASSSGRRPLLRKAAKLVSNPIAASAVASRNAASCADICLAAAGTANRLLTTIIATKPKTNHGT